MHTYTASVLKESTNVLSDKPQLFQRQLRSKGLRRLVWGCDTIHTQMHLVVYLTRGGTRQHEHTHTTQHALGTSCTTSVINKCMSDLQRATKENMSLPRMTLST